MERLWGEVRAVPTDRVRVLAGGEEIGPFRVAYTPGHASHHVCYLHTPSGTAFTGDVAGVRIDGALVLAPTPPPDVDLRAWRASLDAVAAWRPRALALTHFGSYDDVEAQLEAMREELARAGELARDLDERGFIDAVRARVAAHARPQTAAAYEQAMPPWQSYRGLARAAERAQARRVCEHPRAGGSTS
jgi:glyoxylase-like metal-dependent hydrolase (beta-lactamase superfamily II)